jgi:hypothetical protein
LIGSRQADDLSARQAARRPGPGGEVGAVLLAPTEWSARRARESAITGGLPSKVFPIPLDLEVLRPVDDPQAACCRARPTGRGPRPARPRIDPALTYKGFGLLLEALRLLDAQGIALHVAVLGETGLMGAGWKHVTYTELGVRRGDAALAGGLPVRRLLS